MWGDGCLLVFGYLVFFGTRVVSLVFGDGGIKVWFFVIYGFFLKVLLVL